MIKDLNYYLLYIDDIRSDLGVTIRRKAWKYKERLLRSLQVLIEILEDVTNEALSSELLNLNDKEEMQREVITLLKQFEVAKKTLSALAELQISLPHPRVDGYRNLDWN